MWEPYPTIATTGRVRQATNSSPKRRSVFSSAVLGSRMLRTPTTMTPRTLHTRVTGGVEIPIHVGM